ncbi:type I glyceraldehyde-3-phosphate dehydrogenase [bacterium]|nr:type I glyceraldehyde-3-phosphate dehydrogenase [candidate division CSSED10-310 bacterium]
MSIKIAINGFGRIGRLVFRAILEQSDYEVVAINDLTDAETLAHLLKYDSVHGRFSGLVTVDGEVMVVNGRRIPISAQKDITKLDWKAFKKDGDTLIVVESTGFYRDPVIAREHVRNGADKVIISAPAKKNKPDATIVLGVNESHPETGYRPEHQVISNASCTTNCLGPMVKVLNDAFGIVKGFMTTIHSYTNDQRILDLPHSDLRRARAAALSQIPTTTGAASAIGKVLPDLAGKLDGISVRVPTPNVSLVDLVVELARPATVDQIKAACRAYAQDEVTSRYMLYTEEPVVSSDFNHDPHSCIVDGEFIKIIEGTNLVKMLAWYDNEWAYSCRIVDLITLMTR